jgi:hypothetical protein
MPKGLADQFRAGAVFGLAELLDFLHYFGRDRDGHCLSCWHWLPLYDHVGPDVTGDAGELSSSKV